MDPNSKIQEATRAFTAGEITYAEYQQRIDEAMNESSIATSQPSAPLAGPAQNPAARPNREAPDNTDLINPANANVSLYDRPAGPQPVKYWSANPVLNTLATMHGGVVGETLVGEEWNEDEFGLKTKNENRTTRRTFMDGTYIDFTDNGDNLIGGTALKPIKDDNGNWISASRLALDEAKFAWDQSQDLIANALAERKMTLDEAEFAADEAYRVIQTELAREQMALQRRGQDLEYRANQARTGVQAILGSMPFMVPKGMNSEFAALANARSTGRMPKFADHSTPFPYNPKTIADELANQATPPA
jgi:hypothetical protein